MRFVIVNVLNEAIKIDRRKYKPHTKFYKALEHVV